jgi:hypothetical protein
MDTEVTNLKNLLKEEKRNFEIETKERLLREIQVTKIEIEENRQTKALKEAALKKDMIIFEKKKELY